MQDNVHQILNSNERVGYKIIECVFCRALYVMRQYHRGKADEIIPIKKFGAADVKRFSERNNDRGSVKFSMDVLNQMVMKK